MKNYKQEIENKLRSIQKLIDNWHEEGTGLTDLSYRMDDYISNLISEILDSCPLVERESDHKVRRGHIVADSKTGLTKEVFEEWQDPSLINQGYNQAVSKYEAWKKEVK